MLETKPLQISEFVIGSEVPILEHLGKLGVSCFSLIGEVTKMDENNKPVKAQCIKCIKSVIIDWQNINSKQVKIK